MQKNLTRLSLYLPYPSSLNQAYFGAYDICQKDWTQSQEVESSNILVHPGNNPQTFANDIAMLRLPRRIQLGSRVQLVNLPPPAALLGCHLIEYDEDQLRRERDQCAYSAVKRRKRQGVLHSFKGTVSQKLTPMLRYINR